MLRSRDNQICLEFAFWKSRPPVALGGIYEMRTYLLKVFFLQVGLTLLPPKLETISPIDVFNYVSPATCLNGRQTGAVDLSADDSSVSLWVRGFLNLEVSTMSTTCGTTRKTFSFTQFS